MNNDSSIPLMSLVIVFTATPWLNLLSHWGSAATLLTIAGRKMMLNHPWLFIANPLPPCGFMCFCAPYSVCCCRILECEITESPSPEISSCQEKAAQDWWMWQIMDEWEEEERQSLYFMDWHSAPTCWYFYKTFSVIFFLFPSLGSSGLVAL